NLLFVMPGQLKVGMGGHGMGSIQTLVNEDALAIQNECPLVKLTAPENSKQASVKAGNKNSMSQVVGTSPSYVTVRNTPVAKGVFFNQSDVNMQRKVAVIGATVVDNIFPNSDPIGKDMLINRIPFVVIGVLEAKGQSGFSNADDQIFIPLSTFQKRVFGIDYLRNINIQIADSSKMDAAQVQVENILRKRHKIYNPDNDDFTVRNQTDMLTRLNDITGAFTLLLGGIACISLLVGGIGIMNIMLVSVTERTREIGLRKALGATKYDILIQFLIESIVLCVMGGVIGILAGVAMSYAISYIGNWNTDVSAQSIILSFGFSVAVGLFFGIYPANKAAGLDCVVALRYE
ncbi:MAG TPA: ABC transporter permease, partial [Candidatus Wallbacteria bacterium]|nr:ABC transporter permease [Candidatus Wallbacteria bacterium]